MIHNLDEALYMIVQIIERNRERGLPTNIILKDHAGKIRIGERTLIWV